MTATTFNSRIWHWSIQHTATHSNNENGDMIIVRRNAGMRCNSYVTLSLNSADSGLTGMNRIPNNVTLT
jgi:hypothetical protein